MPYLVLYVAVLNPQIPGLPLLDTIGQGLYHGLVFNILGIVLYGWAIGRLGAASAVMAMPLMPAFGTLQEWALLGRPPHNLVPIALLLMAIGVGLAARPPKE